MQLGFGISMNSVNEQFLKPGVLDAPICCPACNATLVTNDGELTCSTCATIEANWTVSV